MNLKTILFTFLTGMFFVSPAYSQIKNTRDQFVRQKRRQPNVIIIFADDQGSVDLNCYGAKDLHTPNLDLLAEAGVRFTQFYSAAPVCSPSRAGLLTGRMPQRAGVPGNVSSAKGKAGMPTDQITIAEMMKNAGYVTGHVGKWHLGFTKETMPNGQGFDSSYGHMGGCIDNYSHFFYWNGPNRHDLWRDGKEIFEDGQFFPTLMTRECNAFIEKNREKPFFLYWAINVTHYPLQAIKHWRNIYNDLPSPRKEYAAFVSTMDEQIGQVIKKLNDLKLREETIIIFQSDHGHSTEVRTFGGGGSAGVYRGAKFSLFEGGIRIPAIISWKNHLPKNEVRNQLCTGCDWFPTIAKLCNVELPPRKLDGKNILPVIKSNNASSPHENFYWQMGKQWAVRKGDWKLIGNPRDTSNKAKLGKSDKLYLVNLKDDVTEMKNLAVKYPEKVKELDSVRDKWINSLAK